MQSEYTHAVVNHKAKQFVDGQSHTNTIEGFWSQLKRSVFGIYHSVSAKYLQRYVDEAVFRYNTRKESESDVFRMMIDKCLVGQFSYKDVRMAAQGYWILAPHNFLNANLSIVLFVDETTQGQCRYMSRDVGDKPYKLSQ